MVFPVYDTSHIGLKFTLMASLEPKYLTKFLSPKSMAFYSTGGYNLDIWILRGHDFVHKNP
jgi:hypothetical protein